MIFPTHPKGKSFLVMIDANAPITPPTNKYSKVSVVLPPLLRLILIKSHLMWVQYVTFKKHQMINSTQLVSKFRFFIGLPCLYYITLRIKSGVWHFAQKMRISLEPKGKGSVLLIYFSEICNFYWVLVLF